jgi:hypothetical protein
MMTKLINSSCRQMVVVVLVRLVATSKPEHMPPLKASNNNYDKPAWRKESSKSKSRALS